MSRKVLIAVPCMDMVAAQFAHSLATLQKGDNECTISMILGSLIYESRNKFAKQAYTIDADYILWLDSDMTFPPDTLLRLIKDAEAGADVVTGLYFRRAAPYTPVLFKEHTGQIWTDYNDYKDKGDEPFPVAGCGFGCVLTSKTVMIDVILNSQGRPFDPKDGQGEDLAFCDRATSLGYKIVCDPTIKCGHVGHVLVDEAVYLTTFNKA